MPDGDPVVREPEAVVAARCELGEQLAACRRLAGLTQTGLASLIAFSRSTVANVETGRQHVSRGFWESADAAVNADGALLTAFDEAEATARRARTQAAALAGPVSLPAVVAGQPKPVTSLVTVAVPGQAQPDLIATATNQARDHAARAAVTGIGPGTVEQLTAQAVRLGRAYVS
jgi:transcriptional regulator with XRE-family HTH domain